MNLRLRPFLDEGREEIAGALEEAKEILTKEQWDRVPDAIKNPFGGGEGEAINREGLCPTASPISPSPRSLLPQP